MIIADEPKLVSGLGATMPVPVEVVSFGWETTALRLAKIGGRPVLERGRMALPFYTDGGNLILDCHFGAIADPAALERIYLARSGVVETGLFIGMATTALVATPGGIVRLDRSLVEVH